MAWDTDKRAVWVPRFSLAWPCVAGAMLIMSLLCGGCSKGAASIGNANASAEVESIFAEREQAVACPAECVETAISIARAGLGLDPAGGRGYRAWDPNEIFESLRRDARPVGSTILRVPVADVLAKLSEGPMSPAILVNKTGHLYALFGAIRVDGKLMPQIVHGFELPMVVSTEAVLGGGFGEAWLLSKKPGVGVPVRVGSSTVEINELWHNFGETHFGKPRNCSFRITCHGPKGVVLDRPTTSCTCTAQNLSGAALEPGKSLDMAVEEAANSSPRNSIQLTFHEKRGGASRQVDLILIGSQLVSMEVTPEKLDFGTVVPGEAVTRAVCLVEKQTDRFAVRGIDVMGLSAAHRVETAIGSDGTATYRVFLDLTGPDGPPGERHGQLVIATDSRTRPTVTVPVSYTTAPPVWAVPSVLAIGSVAVGELRQQRVEFFSRDGGPVEVGVRSAPDECVVRAESGTPAAITVATKLRRAGIWQGVIRVEARHNSRSYVLAIQCVGYSRE